MSLADLVTVIRKRRAVFHGCEVPEVFEADGCNIEWLASGVVTRENRVVAGAVEGKLLTIDLKLLAIDVKTYKLVPIKEHGVDGEIVRKISMAAFHDAIRRLREIVPIVNKFSTTESN